MKAELPDNIEIVLKDHGRHYFEVEEPEQKKVYNINGRDMSHEELETRLTSKLLDKGIPAS